MKIGAVCFAAGVCAVSAYERAGWFGAAVVAVASAAVIAYLLARPRLRLRRRAG